MTRTYEIIEHTYDVVIVGAGGAGMRAALGMALSLIYQRPFGDQTIEYGKKMAQRTCAAADQTDHAILHTLYQRCLEFNTASSWTTWRSTC